MLEKGINISLLLDFYGKLLTERQFEVLSLYRNDDLSLGEISEITGITRQGVSDCIHKAEATLIAYEEKLGLEKAYHERKNILERAREKIEELAMLGGISKESAKELAKLLEKAE